MIRQNFHRVSFLGHLNLAKQHWLQTGFQCKQQSANTNTKLLTKHVSNTSQTKRAECKPADFDQTEKNSLCQSWSILHTSGQSCFKHILLVNASHFWSIPHTSGQSLLVDASHVTSAISGQSFTLLINLSHFCQ